MGPQPKALPAYSKATNVKELLELIGKVIQKEAHEKALEPDKGTLKALLSRATYGKDKVVQGETLKACDLDHEYHTNVTDGHSDPCGNRPDVRFSDIYEGQCTDSKIRGNDQKQKIGACAPFRRLFLCDQNLEYIKPEKITSTDNLLLEVSLAAQHEGESIVKNYEQLGHHTAEGICTALARSFADIGDIVRGKDLYIGNKGEKKKLEANLKKLFEKLYEELTKNNNNVAIKTYYEQDGPDYYQLREDWWELNRQEIWKAIICQAPDGAFYSARGCCGGKGSTSGHCKCIDGTVPTNFDYVPQYLRWFEEWTEEFCRIKQIKLQKLEQDCRGVSETGNKRYCSRNGCDCEETINKIGHLRYGNRCTKCLFGCNRYIDWINKKKEEFEKQKKKCENEKNTNNKGQKTTSSDINNIYYQQFYKQLNEKYTNIRDFLRLLNEETKCKNIDEEDKESKIDFNNNKTTFSGSQYCKPCPECGVKCDKIKCEPKPYNEECDKAKKYNPPVHVQPTEINVLSSGEGHEDITEKLKEFCNTPNSNHNSSLYELWKCYYEDEKNEACLLEKKKTSSDTNVQNQKPFFDFFDFWVAHMLKDSIYWRNKLNNCIKNGKATKCKIRCKKSCDCFKRWVEQKKEKEWKPIKEHFGKQKGIPEGCYFTTLEKFLELKFLPLIEEAYDDHEEITRIEEMLYKKSMQSDDTLKDKNDIIDILLDHEKEDAKTCTQIHNDENCSDDHEEDEELPPSVKHNPCARVQPTKTIKEIARQMHLAAKKQLDDDGSKDDLKADASQGNYSRGGKADDIKNGAICKITDEHSNDTRGSTNGGPCQGKDNGGERFKIGNGWKILGKDKTTYTDLYLPPRRQHMCTSNLENLNIKSEGLSESKLASNSLLGDVLLTAKMDAEKIKSLYIHQNGKKELKDAKDDLTICRAVRYSFADIGDIIRGRDMWENGEAKSLQGNLVTIFEKIKTELEDNLNGKYKNDPSPYKKLREDWWEANRKDVWRAMQCSKNNDGIYCGATPHDDYIPQRLRWMTEWAEWFCKEQSRLYGELLQKCGNCKNKIKGKVQGCTQSTPECGTCTAACTEYNRKIEQWKKQWNNMLVQYLMLYWQAETAAANGGPNTSSGAVEPKDKPVIEFLFELYKQNGGKIGNPSDNIRARHRRSAPRDTTHVYSTPAGYIHQEAQISDCNIQTDFCEKKKGGKEDNDKYVFKDKPHDHDTPCNCDKPPKKDACEIVENLIGKNHGNNDVGECKRKEKYQPWNCDEIGSLIKKEEKGACMPPRRQKLCLYFVADPKETEKIKKQDDLTDAFIKTAAAETFLSWQYYKSKKDDAEKILKQGEVPPEFLRSMFYTYADYRDICMDTDISKKEGHVKKAKDKIDAYFKKNPDPVPKKWWDTNGPDIWKGMLCALEKASGDKVKFTDKHEYTFDKVTFSGDNSPTLEKFAQTPQFLRWFTEWSDDFCIQQKKELKTLENKCNFSTCDDANDNQKKIQCHQACWNYKAFLKKWKKQYKKQNIKYEGLRYTNNIIEDKEAHQYFKKIFKDKDFCIKEYDRKHYNKSFEYPPQNFKDKCLCSLTNTNERDDSKKRRSEPEQKKEDPYKDFEKCPFENSGNSGDGSTVINNDNCKNLNVQSLCIQNKYENNLDQWTGKLVRDSSKDNEGVLMPPRRVHLCTRTITKNKYRTNETDKFKKDLFDSAYNQGFLLGIKYKDYNDEGHEALKNSFADYGDIIKGKDMMEGANIDDFNKGLKKMFPENNENTGRTTITRDQWWTTNKHKVWNAMLCGYHKGITEPPTPKKRKSKSPPTTEQPKNTNIPSSWCSVPTDDSTDQFLRWLREWGTQYCKEKQQLKSNMQMPCKSHFDKYGIIENRNDVHPNCLPSLDKYEVWSNNRLPEFDRLSNRFTKYKNDNQNSNITETSAQTYLNKHCSKCICSFKDIEQTHEKSIKGGHDIFVDILDKAQIPGFVEDIAYRYKGPKPECPNDIECSQYRNIQCRGLPHDDNRDWNSSFVKNNNAINKGVLLPPRRIHLCLSIYPQKIDYLRKEINNFKNFICSSAFSEAKRLKKVYKDDNDKLLQAIKYSFSDIGSIVKGEDMKEGTASDNIAKIFNGKKFSETNRKKWWNENKYHVWESMLCGYRKAVGNTQTNLNCRFPDIERVPQFLRWFQEWGENFCTKRNELYKKIDTNCTSATCNKEDGSVAKTECTKACEEYKNY
ncbi:hypothetical protein PFTANZ_06695, partial [Plasmodium falciparum Tanzania (2000708)]